MNDATFKTNNWMQIRLIGLLLLEESDSETTDCLQKYQSDKFTEQGTCEVVRYLSKNRQYQAGWLRAGRARKKLLLKLKRPTWAVKTKHFDYGAK
jgi:hypothetical protein